MIYYFSGTGNSKHAAEVIAASTGDTAVNIVDAIKNNILGKKDDELTGFVFPVYFWGLPEIIKRFASMPEVRKNLGKYVFCVITCGANTGSADKILSKKLGRNLDYSFSLKMPDNYVVMYDPCEKQKAQRYLRHADKELETVCADIKKREKGRKGSTQGGVKSAFVSHFYNPFRKTKKFYADDKCISCGICAKNCPDNAIEMQNGKPVWVKSKCQHCTACINCCPKESVQYGKSTQTRRRYSYENTVD
ncbi:MAG: EFR1 family ferrodoxin [Acutalibacteraceae bacterium]|nr:EFR1 family ferrodoxin [Acutalibacteraceae bacterium]